jgi:methyl-accepting chemotaxis protein
MAYSGFTVPIPARKQCRDETTLLKPLNSGRAMRGSTAMNGGNTMKISDLSISTRFAILIALFLLGFCAYGGWSFKTLNELKVNGPVYHRIVQSKDIVADILPPPEYIIESYLVSLQLSAASDKASQDKLIERLKTLRADYDTRHAYWEKEALEPALGEPLLVGAHKPALEFYGLAVNELVPAVQKQDSSQISAAMTKISQAYEVHRAAIDNVVALANKRAEADEADARERILSATWMLCLILGVSITLGVVVASLIARGIVHPLRRAVDVAQTVAGGDLTCRVESESKDETGQLLRALREMSISLAGIVSQVRTGTECIGTASKQIATGNLDLSARTEEQAASLEETASSMEELTSTVRQNADNARQASTLALSASEVASRGGSVVAEVIQTMGSINESSRRIVDIISVIDGIAFQTNILALNAAVEAARAGEQGRGFAVVAAEVRNLAQRSASAAKEIKTLIGDSVEQVHAGAKLVDEAGATMQEVVQSVQRVTDIISEIAAASNEQTSGIEQINQAILRMDEVTQQNASLVEEAAAASEAMQEQAGGLAKVVGAFRLDAA